MDFLKKFFNMFKTGDSFENDPYGWVTNQIGHISLSFVLCYFTGLWQLILAAWIVWEINHFLQSKDWKDLFEDLFFELSGVFIYLYGDVPLIFSIVILILLLCLRVSKIK